MIAEDLFKDLPAALTPEALREWHGQLVYLASIFEGAGSTIHDAHQREDTFGRGQADGAALSVILAAKQLYKVAHAMEHSLMAERCERSGEGQ